ncbi:methylesterase 1-like [Prosopis cineraria]|uniref:methylesterase 1-like n=1 Tax=Prosopis cineraria TaxID=364024 RepID=UPI00240E9D09|nr:methylesterase 1-like [Prosopis cineraria]
MVSETESKKHFVLVHGSCHGAWCWYKVKPRLQSAGHRVTVLDLAASGIHPSKIEDLGSLLDYSQPLLKLLASLPPDDKVVLVGHSFAGMNLALALDLFPHKVALAVFLTAFLPDTHHSPSYVLRKFLETIPTDAGWLDTEFSNHGTLRTLLFGPKFLSSKLYQLCSPQDVELAKALMRPASYFVDDLSKANNFSQEGYGSVPRVFITCNEDLTITIEFQHWMIHNAGVKEILEIKDSDHMPMLSKPQELCDALLLVASKHDA